MHGVSPFKTECPVILNANLWEWHLTQKYGHLDGQWGGAGEVKYWGKDGLRSSVKMHDLKVLQEQELFVLTGALGNRKVMEGSQHKI